MKTKYSVGNRVEHYSFGEGMIVQIKNNQIEVLFLDEVRRNFPLESNDIKIINNQIFEDIKPELPIPSTANKLKKELDQLKEGNRTDFFDYEMANQTNMSLNKNSRIYHTLLGEGMITKILKNEYQIIFLTGEKHNIPINSPDLKKIPYTEIDDSIISEKPLETLNNNLNNSENLYIGKHISIPDIGDGMVSKIDNNSYEVIFLDGHKESFLTSPKSIISTPSINDIHPIEINESKEVTSSLPNDNLLHSELLKVGKQFSHPEFGEGMVSKITNTNYEIIFLNGQKRNFPLLHSETENIENKNITTSYEKQSDSASLNQDLLFNSKNLSVGKQINIPEHGEAMISKITNNNIEVIFLDGHKQSFPINNIIAEKNINEIYLEEESKTSNSINNNNLQNTFLLKNDSISVGKQINHPEFGEGMISKISSDSYEIFFLNGQKISFPLNENILDKNEISTKIIDNELNKETISESILKEELSELPIEKFQKTNIIEDFSDKQKNKKDISEKSIKDKLISDIEKFKTNEITIGSFVSHKKNGFGIVCNIDESEIEVVFFNHKKIVFSAKSNELTDLNVSH